MTINVGRNIREIRRRKNISQRDIENRIRVSRCALSYIENGHYTPNMGTIYRIAEGLGVGLSEIFIDREKGESKPKLTRDEIAFLEQLKAYGSTIDPEMEWLGGGGALVTIKQAMTGRDVHKGWVKKGKRKRK